MPEPFPWIPKDRLQRIFSLAAPIVTAMTSGNLLNLVDTIMVGTLGNAALAAVGISTFASLMCFSLVMGVSTGVQTIAARRMGQGREAEMAVSLNSGLIFVVLVSVPLTAILYYLVPSVFPYLNSNPEVIALGVPYMRIQVLITILMGLKFAFRGYWNGIGQSRLYMWTLLVMHAVNLVLNYLLIFGKFGFPALGVVGAGLGTALAHVLGVSIYFYLGWTRARPNGFLNRWPSAERLREVSRLAVPSGLQQLILFAGISAFYKIVGLLGTAELAAANVLVNISLVAILPSMGLGLTATTLVGQALGRVDPEDARRWGWDVARVSMVLTTVLVLPMVLFPRQVLAAFLHDPATLELARLPLRVGGFSLIIEGITLILMHSLLGAGDVRRVVVVAFVMQWVLNLPLAYLIGPGLGYGLLEITILGAVTRTIHALIYAGFWRGGRWAEIKV